MKISTLPVRVCIGTFRAVKKEMPDKVEMPFEIKRKEENDGKKGRNDTGTV
jgi:hypothetical protein